MSFDSSSSVWWPFVFILIGGWLATDVWRFLGVYLGARISEGSELLVLVRAIATALVAAVIAKLVLYPAGALATASIFLRVGAAAVGFVAYLGTGKKVIIGIAVAELILLAGLAI